MMQFTGGPPIKYQEYSPATVLDIRISPQNDWQPIVVQQFMIGLFSLPTPLKLIITSRGMVIHWQIMVSTPHVSAVTSIIYSYFPAAQVEQTAPQPSSNSIGTYYIEGAMPFVMPIKHAEDFNHVDPLAALIGMLDGLAGGATVTYELLIKPVNREQFELGQKLLTQPRSQWLDYLTFDGAYLATMNKIRGSDRVERFRSDLQRLARTKMSSLLKEVTLAIKVEGGGMMGTGQLAQNLAGALAVFAREEANFLVMADAKSYPLILSPQETAALWHLPNQLCHSPQISWASKKSAPYPISLSSNQGGIVIGTNEYQGRIRAVTLADRDRETHINILGKNGVGKSTLMLHMILQDIAVGKGVGVIDPHGALIQDILRCGIPPERENDVVLLDIGDSDYPIALNFLKAPSNVPHEEIASQTVSVVRKMFEDTWSGTRMETALYAALITLLPIKGSTIQDVERLFLDSDFRAQVVNEHTDPVALQYWLYQFEPASSGLKLQIASPLTSRLSKFYRNPIIRRIVCQQESLDFTHILKNKKIFLANLSGVSDVEADTLGALLISKFQIAAMSRSRLDYQQSKPFNLYIDEVQNFSTTSLPKLFSEARKYGLSLVVANQYFQQLAGDTLEAILGNVGTSIFFRVGPKDAAGLSTFLQPHYSSHDLQNIGRFHAVVKTQVGASSLPAFSIQTQPPPSPLSYAAQRLNRIRSMSRAQYARPRQEVDAEINQRILRNRPSKDEDSNNSEGGYFG
jgi:hypothetical protein